MGFDLYGLSPNNPNNAVRPESIDWSKEHTEKEKKQYFKEVEEYEEEVIGHYFRNNVWFWRPLWSFVVQAGDGILSEKDIRGGSYNDGHKISKTKANRLATKLKKLIDSGVVDEMQKASDESREKAKKENEKVRAEMDRISDECKAKHGLNLVPADFPEPYKTQWDKAYAKENFAAHYPFSGENIKDFYKFCKNSGGFEIW